MAPLATAIVLAFVGGFIGMKSRIPTGTMLGAAIAVIAYTSLRGKAFPLPQGFNFFIQVLVGLLIAAAYNPDLVKTLSKVLVPMLVSCMALILCGLAVAIIIYKLGYMDFPTAYIATSPGAMNVLITVGMEFHAEVAIVALFHFVRVFIVSLSAPIVFQLFRHHAGL